VVVDVETGGFNERTDALLEIAAVLLDFDENGKLHPSKSYKTHVVPFDGSNLEPKSLEVNGIDPFHPLRAAREEREALAHKSSGRRCALRVPVGKTSIRSRPLYTFASIFPHHRCRKP